jgi:hypothetical protein
MVTVLESFREADRLALSSARPDGPELIELYARQKHRHDDRWLSDTLRFLARCKRDDAVTRWVAGHHAHPSADVRAGVAQALGKIADPSQAVVIGALLEDEDDEVRSLAVMVAPKMRGAVATDVLLRALKREAGSWFSRFSLIEAMDAKDPSAQTALRELAESDPSFWVRREARATVARGMRSLPNRALVLVGLLRWESRRCLQRAWR